MHVTHRPGNISDHGFICSCLLSDARKGHFSINVNDKLAVRQFKQNIAAMFSRHADEQVYTFLIGPQRIGFAIINPVEAGPNCREIYAFSVNRKFRGRGYGRQMLDILMQGLQQHIVYARCAPSSQGMQHMLANRGFQCIQEIDLGIRVFKRANLATTDMVNPGRSFGRYIETSPTQRTQAQSPIR